MKTYIYALTLLISLVSCTKEVVLKDIQNATPRLVVEANINWNKNNDEASKTQFIKLTTSTSYYSQKYPIVTNATVSITNSDKVSMGTFVYDATQKLYVATDFKKPIVGENYILKIELNGQVYTANDEYTSIVTPNSIKQGLNKDIDPDLGVIQVDINIDNEIDVDNYYLFKIEPPKNVSVLPEYSNADDTLISEEPGKNNYDFTYIDSDLSAYDLLKITTYGISKRYNNYLNKITLTAEGGSSGPFSTAPATLRGNILNTNNEENRAFGFFSINQFTYTEYSIKEKSDKIIVTPYKPM